MNQMQIQTDDWTRIIKIFQSKGKLVKFRKKEFYAKQNEAFDSIGYVKKGAFKLVYHNEKREWIKSFLFEGAFLGSIPSTFQKQPSTYSIIQQIRHKTLPTGDKNSHKGMVVFHCLF